MLGADGLLRLFRFNTGKLLRAYDEAIEVGKSKPGRANRVG